MSGNVTEVPTTRKSVLDVVTFGAVRQQLLARMVALGLDPDDPQSWETTIGDMGIEEIVMTICDTERGALFLRALDDLTIVQMTKVGNVLPGIIDLQATTKPEVVALLVEMERLYKQLQERLEVLESNRGLLRGKLGEMMRDNGESEFKACDSRGHPIANIKLDLKFRPSWPERDMQFVFLTDIGQGDIIQQSVPWQTAEKVINGYVDDADDVVRLSEEPTVEKFLTVRAELAKRIGKAETELKFAVIQITDRGAKIVEYTGDDEFPFRPLCNLYQTMTAKVTKLY